MGFPLAAAGEGLSFLSSIAGIFSGNNAARQAQNAANQAIAQFTGAGNQAYSDALGGGTKNLYGLTGTLNDTLQQTGRGLGSALAGAGVYDSTAAAGALANQGAANAQTLGNYSSGLASQLATMRDQNNQEAAQMRLGLATGNLNYARQMQASGAAGIGSMLGNMGQMTQGNLANAGAPQVTGQVPNNSVLPPGAGTGSIVGPAGQNPYMAAILSNGAGGFGAGFGNAMPGY